TIGGITAKLGYLQELGITALWIGPIFKQRIRQNTYHGYAIQDFLDVDPRFGTRQDLVELVETAHSRGIKVILDIIFNHSGDNWAYTIDNVPIIPDYQHWPRYYSDPNDPELCQYKTKWRAELEGNLTDYVKDKNDGVWPEELQDWSCYTRAGVGNLGAGSIYDPHAEHKRSDFFTLKNFALDNPSTFHNLALCYKYWIAITNCDGFRLDTLKHVSIEEARNFCNTIKMFAESIGKCNFFLVGEIGSGDFFQDAYLDQLAVMRSNLDAALDIGEQKRALLEVSIALLPASRYLNGFMANSYDFGSHRNTGKRHISVVDDHDQLYAIGKLRFSSFIPEDAPSKDYHICVPTAIQLFTLGIPCIYYGTEQAFCGPAESQLKFLYSEGWNQVDNYGDRYLREAMFGPEHPRANHNYSLETQLTETDLTVPGFGPFGTAGKHCFNKQHPSYIRISAMTKLRATHEVLRYGLQYQREVQLPGGDFRILDVGDELIAWSRIYPGSQEALCIVNPNMYESRSGNIVVDKLLYKEDSIRELTVILNTAQIEAGSDYDGTHPINSKVPVEGLLSDNSTAYVEISDIPPGEVIVLIKHV
ncbi:MAG: hypothetical protein L3V56_14580, partial [Candidatus Magnetoovum sp. WYHC-5]|nr:hypothetical protein [Candidatus Magnetoovum sp. WYHC-5]